MHALLRQAGASQPHETVPVSTRRHNDAQVIDWAQHQHNALQRSSGRHASNSMTQATTYPKSAILMCPDASKITFSGCT